MSKPVDVIFNGDPSQAVDAAKKVQAETNKIGKEGDKSSKSIDKMGGSMADFAMGTLKAIGLMAVLKKALDGLGVINTHVKEAEKLSRALEISYEKAQELAIAEREAGLAAGTIREAIEGIATAQAQGFINRDLVNLGISLDDIRNKKPDEIFDAIAESFKEGGITARQYDAALNIMGKNASDLALKMAANFDYFREVAKNSGEVIREETFGELIKQQDVFGANIKVIGEDILRLVTPFETFGEAAQKVLGGVNSVIDSIRSNLIFITSNIGGVLGGLSGKEAAEFAQSEVAAARARVQERATQTNVSRSATENLTQEQAEGSRDFFKFLSGRIANTGQNISSLQRVGLAATGGESEAIKLQKRQISVADNILQEMQEQTTIIQRTF